MYRGFNLKFDLTKDEAYARLHKKGLELYQLDKAQVEKTLKAFVAADGTLDGSAMQENWFPQIKADIFISHSHKNLDLAIVLAGWLHETFGIKVFIDSCIWGHANVLLRMVDNDFCMQPDGYYNYGRRNQSTSHIHMMLSTALTMMIDKTECLFFLNTPDSISPTDVIDKTESPWIYSELAMTKMIRQNIPERFKVELSESYYSADGSTTLKKGGPVIKHRVDLDHLTDLAFENLIQWQEKYITGNVFDKLYQLNP